MDRKTLIESRRRDLASHLGQQHPIPMEAVIPNRPRSRMIVENLVREGIVAPERIIDDPDLLKITFLHRAAQRSAAVGRIGFQSSDGAIEGFATGFLIGPHLMMTNNHVFKNQEEVQGCVLQMMYEERIASVGPPSATIPILRLIGTSPELDMSILEVADSSLEGVTTSTYGWIPLEGQLGKIDLKWPVNIIQHPDARTKEIAMRNNELVAIAGKMLEYRTDTLPGSSGSPVFNDLWQLVALHCTGLPEVDANGFWKDIHGNFRDPATLPENQVYWRANGGFRASEIYDFLKKNFGSNPLVERALSGEQPSPPLQIETAPPKPATPAPPKPTPNHRITVPIHIDITVGEIDCGSPGAGASTHLTAEETAKKKKKERPIKPVDFSVPRNGYDPNFLEINIPLPGIQKFDDDVLRLLKTPRKPDKGRSSETELKYFNASIVMSRSRKLAYFAAGNSGVINRGDTDRGADSWFYDDRIDREDQLGNYIYAGNDFDRGHLNRRDDLDWGVDRDAAFRSNDDTFFWPNCTPQHEGFNQSVKDGLWGALENFVTSKFGTSVPFTIFNGPVLSDDDRVSRVDPAIKIPSRFWKVVCVRRKPGAQKALSVTAFLLDQSPLIGDLTESFEFTDKSVKVYQVSLDRLEELTKLDFSSLKGFEPSRPLGRESGDGIYRAADIIVE